MYGDPATPTPPPGPKDFVSKGKGNTRNRLLDGQQYAKLGKNAVLEIRPAVIHFGGYQVGQVHSQKVRVVNVSRESQRVHIMNPTTAHFKARNNKKGSIAPGMSEDIYIDFVPSAWQYYYDCIRLHTASENLLIPIHAYPVMNDVVFPTKIDFGKCALSEPCTRKFKLECKVPIQFEYEFTVIKPHPDIEVFPVKGIVPANSHAPITVKFHPVTIASAECQIEINVSQFNFKPFICTITGFAFAGLVRENALREYAEEQINNFQPLKMPKGSSTKLELGEIEAYDPPAETKIRGAGSGAAADFGGSILAEKRLKATARKQWGQRVRAHYAEKHNGQTPTDQQVLRFYGTRDAPTKMGARFCKMEIKRPPPEPAPPEQTVEGLRIPPNLSGPNALNFVLTQQPGKLKPKDLRAAIDKQRELRAKQKEEQEALRLAQGGADAQPGHLTMEMLVADQRGAGENTTRQLKEMVFLQDLADVDKAERDREFQSQRDCLGELPLTSPQVQFLSDVRDHHNYEHARADRAAQRGKYTVQAHGPYNAREPVRVRVRAGLPPAVLPSFDEKKNDVWGMRKQVLRRFVEAVTIVIVRRRAGIRLTALKKSLAGCRSRQEVRELVERDNRAAQVAGHSSGGGPQAKTRIEPSVVKATLPPEQIEKASGGGRHPMEVDTPRGFNDVKHIRLHVPAETALLGHVPHPQIAVPCYAPLIDGHALLRTGAEQEEPVRQPRAPEVKTGPEDGEEPPPAADAAEGDGEGEDSAAAVAEEENHISNQLIHEACPAITAPPAPPALSLLVPSSRVRAFQELLPRTEGDVDYALRPAVHPREVPPTHWDVTQQAVGSGALASLVVTPTLESRWRPRQEARASSLSAHGRQLEVWRTSSGVPALVPAQPVEDDMSDSESDDDGEDDPLIPTPSMCRSIWEDEGAKLVAEEAGEEEEEAEEEPELDEDGNPIPKVEDPEQDEPAFARDREMLRLEQDKREHALAAVERLNSRMRELKSRISSARNPFALDGYGKSMPAHLRQWKHPPGAGADEQGPVL